MKRKLTQIREAFEENKLIQLEVVVEGMPLKVCKSNHQSIFYSCNLEKKIHEILGVDIRESKQFFLNNKKDFEVNDFSKEIEDPFRSIKPPKMIRISGFRISLLEKKSFFYVIIGLFIKNLLKIIGVIITSVILAFAIPFVKNYLENKINFVFDNLSSKNYEEKTTIQTFIKSDDLSNRNVNKEFIFKPIEIDMHE